MNITLEEMSRINNVQIGILNEIASVCATLNIKFFVVHGTLLGTVRSRGFVPYDDDIDIAIARADYERFLKRAPELLKDGYFLQSFVTDPGYSQAFAKVRDSRTTYIVENARAANMNHGIYVDVFPLDFAQTGVLRKWCTRLLALRVSCAYQTAGAGVLQTLKRFAVRLLIPSLKWAIRQRDWLARTAPESDLVCMTGGKVVERQMPAQWFRELVKSDFEKVEVYIPGEYDKYLRHIYGNYETRTLVEGKMADERHVILNACVVDVDKPYTHYT